MISPALVLFASLASATRAAVPFFDVHMAASNGSGLTTQAEGGTSFDKERYRISARLRTSRLGEQARGTREEYSLRMTRELYFVTVSGRLGTSPPNSQGAGYHLASGAASFKFYGLNLAPEHPELSAVIWESSGPVPDPSGLDRTWITRLDSVYTNVNNHIGTNNGIFILVEGAWQFSIRETYLETTTVGFQGGGSRYNKIIDGATPVVTQNVVDYWGNYMPITGWPNSWQSLRLDRAFGPVVLSAAGTRMNMINGGFRNMAGLEAAWKINPRWTVRAGLERATGHGEPARNVVAFGVSSRWE